MHDNKEYCCAILAIGFALFLSSCGPNNENDQAAKARKQARITARAEQEAEAGLMENQISAGTELVRRLTSTVSRKGPLLFVRTRQLPSPDFGWLLPPGKDFTIAAMPAGTPWAVKCTAKGMSVTFGPWQSGEVTQGDGEFGPDVNVELTNAKLTVDQCNALTPTVAAAAMEFTKASGQ